MAASVHSKSPSVARQRFCPVPAESYALKTTFSFPAFFEFPCGYVAKSPPTSPRSTSVSRNLISSAAGNIRPASRISLGMPFLYRILADAIVVFHAAYVLWVILGLLLTLLGMFRRWQWIRNPWFRWSHLAMILIVVVESWLGIVCPLTTWEQALRAKAGDETYRGDFLANFVHEALFIEAPPWAFTVGYTIFGLLVLATFLWAPPRRRSSRCSLGA